MNIPQGGVIVAFRLGARIVWVAGKHWSHTLNTPETAPFGFIGTIPGPVVPGMTFRSTFEVVAMGDGLAPEHDPFDAKIKELPTTARTWLPEDEEAAMIRAVEPLTETERGLLRIIRTQKLIASGGEVAICPRCLTEFLEAELAAHPEGQGYLCDPCWDDLVSSSTA